MNPAEDPIIDQSAQTSESGKRLTTWYAQGHSDGLGDRLLMFDNTTAPSWEILRFKPALASSPQFETALRHTIERLGSFRHQAFPAVRPIAELGHEDGLAVVSTYASGVCLAEGLKKPRSAGFALRLLRQLMPALAALHQHDAGLFHGALTIDRFILTNEGRLMIREHMVGPALASLRPTAARMWADFGILGPVASPESDAVTLDQRGDVIQVALVVVSLMAGRRVSPEDYPQGLREVLDPIEDRHIWHEPESFRSLRAWLERALQMRERGFESAREAYAALMELSADTPRPDTPTRLQLAQRRAAPETAHAAPAEVARAHPPEVVNDDRLAPPAPHEMLPFWRRDPRILRWGVIAVAVIAVAEGALIGRLMLSNSADRSAGGKTAATQPATKLDPIVKDQPRLTPPPSGATTASAGSAPALTLTKANPPVVPDIRSAAMGPESPGKTAARPALLVQAPAASPRSGGFRVSAPIELHVLDGERVLGSSAEGPIIAPAGPHEYEFVNSAIGYRARRVVDVKAGEIIAVALAVPNGTLNINATPWAAVWIDGNAFGETPLGNLSITPGEHEIVFRHPQFGERREKATVRSDATTRVAVAFK